MAGWLVPGLISTFAATLILAGVFWSLFRTEREEFVRLWALSWSVYALRFVFELIAATTDGSPWLNVLGQGAVLIAGALLLEGTYVFLERPWSRWWWVAFGASGAWTAAASLLSIPQGWGLDPGTAFTVTVAPNFLIVGVAYLITGIAWLRSVGSGSQARRTTGVLFVAWALHKFDFPFLRPVEWFAPWGYLIASALSVSVAVALLLVYFRRAVAELERSGERYRSLFEGGHTPILVVDAVQARIVEANEAAGDFYGYPLTELIGMDLSRIESMPEEDIANNLSTALRRRSVGTFRHLHRLADGSVRTVDVQSGMQVVDGREVIVGMIFDVTAEVEATAALRESEDRYAALFESNPLSIIVVEPESMQVLQVNSAAADFYGIDADAVAGTPLSTVVGTEGEDFIDRLEAALVDGIPYIETRHKRIDGAIRDMEVQVAPMTSGGRTLLSLLAADVTERNQAYIDLKRYRDNLEKIVEARTAELEKTNRELEEASRAKSQFLANMSHELRTPLNSIIGFTGIMLQGLSGELNDEQERQLGMVNRSGKHLLELINAVLDLSKIEAGRVSLDVSEVDACAVIDSVVEALRPLARERDVELVHARPQEPCDLETDETRLRQILLNLIGNAVKFTEVGSVTITPSMDDDTVSIAVVDTGPGIASRDLPHIFEEFRQLEPQQGQAKSAGTGLGLPVSLRLAQLLGGDIQAQSDLGRGSTFTVIVPRCPPESAPVATPALAGVARGYDASRVVLLIDDDPSIHDLFRVYLAREGVRILHAYDLETGTKILRRQRVSLVILDIEFEDGSGWSLLKHLREDRSLRDVPVVLCSVKDEPEKAARFGASAHLVKPVEKDALIAQVRRFLEE